MLIGGEVITDGMTGRIVCDFDNRHFLDGYEVWDMPGVEMLGGGTLSSGMMIETVEAGLIHYKPVTGDIEHVFSPPKPAIFLQGPNLP